MPRRNQRSAPAQPPRTSLSGDVDGTPDEINATIHRMNRTDAVLPARDENSDVTTILAALRLFQRTYADKDAAAIAADWPDYFTEGMQSVSPAPLGTEDIDSLCEALNCGDIELYAPMMGESLPQSKTWTPPNANAFLKLRDNDDSQHAPCGCILEPRGGTGAAFYMCETHERAADLVYVLRRAVPWLGKMIADGAHRNSVLPKDCENTLAQAEALLGAITPKVGQR